MIKNEKEPKMCRIDDNIYDILAMWPNLQLIKVHNISPYFKAFDD